MIPPNATGKHGKAWLYNPKTDGPHAGIGCWIVEAPWAHPLWHSYAISLAHMRHVEGLQDNHVYLEGATHEIYVFALDPNADLEKIISGEEFSGPALLHPMNFAAQFIANDDEEAQARVYKSIKEIIDGKLSPDTDFISMWVQRYGDNMLRKGLH